MALHQSALLDMLEVLKTSDGGELMRRMLAMMLQELIDVEATSVTADCCRLRCHRRSRLTIALHRTTLACRRQSVNSADTVNVTAQNLNAPRLPWAVPYTQRNSQEGP